MSASVLVTSRRDRQASPQIRIYVELANYQILYSDWVITGMQMQPEIYHTLSTYGNYLHNLEIIHPQTFTPTYILHASS